MASYATPLPACAAGARLLQLLLTAGRAAIDQHLLAAGPTAANRGSGVRWPGGTDRQTDRQTDGRAPVA